MSTLNAYLYPQKEWKTQATWYSRYDRPSRLFICGNSYGFRTKQSIHDAIAQCFLVLSRKASAQWVLGEDIKSCFDKISHSWLEENAIMYKRGNKIKFVRYAGWICTAAFKEILESNVLPTVIKFLKKRGLELSLEKTKITHIDEGFDFLGFNLRKYRGKLLIKPVKKRIKAFLEGIRETINSMRAETAKNLILTSKASSLVLRGGSQINLTSLLDS